MTGVKIKKNVCSFESLAAHIQIGDSETKVDSIKANFLFTIFLKTKYVIKIPPIEAAKDTQKSI